MSNEHIGRTKQFGLANQSAAGTPDSPTIWIPCSKLDFKPIYPKSSDDAAYGVVDELTGAEYVLKKSSEVSGECLARDVNIGHFLKAAFSTEYLVDLITISGEGGGSPARGDAVTSATGSWAGVIRKVLTIGAVTYYAVSTTSGDVTDLDSKTDLTNGTWTGGTCEQSDFSAAKGHYFERENTNFGHPIYSLYTEDIVAGRETSDASLESFDFECLPDTYPKINFMFKGINIVDGGALTPATTTENMFLPSHSSVKFAATEDALNAASAIALRRFKFSAAKNLLEEMECGKDGAVASYLPQNPSFMGDMELLFNDEVYRNYHLDNSYKACRVALLNDTATPLVDLTADIVPSLYIDMYKSYFNDWGQSNDLNGITSQTLGYRAHYDKEITAMTIDCLLINSRATSY